MTRNTTRRFLYFLAALFLINLLQSHFTELLYDEAYYWYYARKLSWGYFDHPPMVALMIAAGNLFLEGELGVRFMSCIFSVGTPVVLWQIIEHPRKEDYIPHFWMLLFSMTLLNAYGFFTLPDTPLLFFTALFLWLYKLFLTKESVPLAIALGLVMAALMYSKYHAVLVILCIVISNVRLVLNPYAWLAVAVGIISYTPHLIWLFKHDFVSIKYHLFERPNRAYDFNDFTLGYLINLIALFGLTFPWIYQSLFKTRPSNPFTRALLFLVYGVLLFFFVSSFQRRVQTQWIIVVCIPMVLIAFQYMLENPTSRKWLIRSALANILVLFVLRIGLIFEPLFPITFETHGNKAWVNELKSKAGDTPVVFENSYREAPMYAFYSGNTAFSLNNIYYRENQYDIDGSEALVQHRKILYIAKWYKEGDISYTTPQGDTYFGKYFDNFESYRELECSVLKDNISDWKEPLLMKVYNPYTERIPLKKLKFGIAYLDSYKHVKHINEIKPLPITSGIEALKARDSTDFKIILPDGGLAEAKYFKVTISENGLLWGINGNSVKLE